VDLIIYLYGIISKLGRKPLEWNVSSDDQVTDEPKCRLNTCTFPCEISLRHFSGHSLDRWLLTFNLESTIGTFTWANLIL
jgi:hypothetical protein